MTIKGTSIVPNHCKCDKLVLLRSINIKMCPDCKKKYIWNLDKGQKPLITSSRDRGMEVIDK